MKTLKDKISTFEPIDLSEKLRPHEGKWVTLSLDHKKVLGTGESLKKAKESAEKKSKEYVFIKLAPFDVSYVSSF